MKKEKCIYFYHITYVLVFKNKHIFFPNIKLKVVVVIKKKLKIKKITQAKKVKIILF